MGGYQQLPITPYKPADPAEQIQKGLQLRSLLQGQQFQQQQIQGAQLDNQQKQQGIQDQQAMTAAMREWDGKDFNTLPALLLKHGGSGQLAKDVKTSLVKQQTDLVDLAIKQQQGISDQFKNEQTKNDWLAQRIEDLKSVPPDQQPQAFETMKADAVQRGFLEPQRAQQWQYQGPDQLASMEKGLTGHAGALNTAAKQAEEFKNRQQGNEAAANTEKIKTMQEWYKQHGMAPGVSPEEAGLADWLQKNPGKGPSDYQIAMKKIVPAFVYAQQNAGAQGQNGQPSAVAKSIAFGEMKWQDVISPRTPMSVKEAILREVKGINPNFNSGDFDVEKLVREDFTSGTDSNSLTAINRAREHMQVFLQTARDLDNGSVQAFNRIGQAFGTQFGSDKAGNLTIAKQAFSSEVGKAFAGANVALGDRKEIGDQIGAASSFQQLAGVARTADALLAGAQKVLKQKYDQGIQGKPNFGGEQAGPGSNFFSQFGGKPR